jgi:predicted GNAT family N-acyltransferase
MQLTKYDFIDAYYFYFQDTNKDKWMKLDTLIIRGIDNRHKGYGTEMLNEIIKIAKEENCKYIEIHADKKQPQREGFVLVDWYKRFGFESVKDLGWMEVMRKTL